MGEGGADPYHHLWVVLTKRISTCLGPDDGPKCYHCKVRVEADIGTGSRTLLLNVTLHLSVHAALNGYQCIERCKCLIP